jgi:hypothetical protein
MGPATAGSIVIMVVLIVGAGYTVSQTDSTASSLSTQVVALNSTAVALNIQVTSLMSRPPVTTTSTQTITSTVTSTQTSTTTQSFTTTQTSFVTSTSTTSIYPIPNNVTVVIVASGQFENYAINAGSYSGSGSLGNSPQSFFVSPVFQGEAITVSITLSCPGSTGPSGSASLYVDSDLVSHTTVACGGNTTGQISYVL